jgi:hypothetical protein
MIFMMIFRLWLLDICNTRINLWIMHCLDVDDVYFKTDIIDYVWFNIFIFVAIILFLDGAGY